MPAGTQLTADTQLTAGTQLTAHEEDKEWELPIDGKIFFTGNFITHHMADIIPQQTSGMDKDNRAQLQLSEPHLARE